MSPIEMMVDVACVHAALQEVTSALPPDSQEIMAWIAEGYSIDETIAGLLTRGIVPDFEVIAALDRPAGS